MTFIPESTRLAKAWHYLTNRRRIVRDTIKLNTPGGQAFISELARFCRINEGVWDNDERRTHVLIGRQEVYHWIMQHLKLSPEQHFELANGKTIQVLIAQTGEEEEEE